MEWILFAWFVSELLTIARWWQKVWHSTIYGGGSFMSQFTSMSYVRG